MFNEIIDAYKNFWLEAGNFKGSTTRSDWWWVQLINFIISVISIPIFYKTFGFNVYGLLCLVPQIAIDIRRIKDFGKDWKWIFINLIPIIGWLIWWLWMGFGKSGRGKNNFI
tara:strand:- start:66 stop:401 length:336 start_codon:yes stop_codon:yes gene_type:complete